MKIVGLPDIYHANTRHGRSKIPGVPSIVTFCYHTSVSHMGYLVRRGAFYYFKLCLPKLFFLSCHTLHLSLSLITRQTATFVAASLGQVHQHLAKHPTELLETLRTLCIAWRNAIPATPSVRSPTHTADRIPMQAHQGPTLAELSKKYLEEGEAGDT